MRLVVIIAAVAMEAWLPIYGQDKAGEAKGQKQDAQKEQQPTPDSGPTKGTGDIATINKPAPQGDIGGKNPSDHYLDVLVSPNNLPNLVLAIVGMVGIVVALFTLRWLKRQTGYIRDQASLMKDQLSLMDKQLNESQRSGAEASLIAREAAEAAKANAEAAKQNAIATRESVELLISKERVHISVEVAHPDLTTMGDGAYRIE